MLKNHLPLLIATLLGTQLCQADSRHYHTAPAAPAAPPGEQFEIPLIEIDPDSGEQRIYLAPPGDKQRLVASAGYRQDATEAAAPGLHQAIGQLHQQMAAACPQGWVKLEEWAVTDSSQINLHYAFACIGQ